MAQAEYVTAIRVADGTDKKIDYNALANLPDLDEFATLTQLNGFATQLENKADKEEGKVLSSNDYTTEEKTKLANIEKFQDGLSPEGPIYLIKDVHYFDSINAIPTPYESGRLYLVKVEE